MNEENGLVGSQQPSIPPIPPHPPRPRGRVPIFGIILVLTGLLLLADNLGWLRWFDWSLYWPVILIVIGILIILRRTGRS